MFENLDAFDKVKIYKGLKLLVESKDGYGFYNNDKGHPAYVMGANGKIDHAVWGDSPEHNRLFKMLSELSKFIKTSDLMAETGDWYDFSEWQDFCRLSVSTFRKHHHLQAV